MALLRTFTLPTEAGPTYEVRERTDQQIELHRIGSRTRMVLSPNEAQYLSAALVELLRT